MAAGSFGWVDYIVFSLMLLVSASIGIYYRLTGGRQQTTKEYLLADHSMGVLPVSFSLMASFMSAVTLLGVSSENYIYGTQFVVINCSYFFGTLVSAYIYLPVFFKLQTTSAYQYLEFRFSKSVRLAASFCFIVQMVLYMSIVLYAPALALNAVTGLSKWTSILSVGLVCTFYCTIGGMKAVLWTDVFQSILMFVGVLAVVISGLVVQGFADIWDIAEKGGRLEFLNLSMDPTIRQTVWTQVIGGFFMLTSLYAVNQAQVQRLLTVKNLAKAQWSLLISTPILVALSITTSFAGLVIYAAYHACDPIAIKRIALQDQLLPLYVMDHLAHIPGLPGLFVSGILSGALSTVSSAVNSLAAVTLEDFIKPFLGTKSDKAYAALSKTLVFGFGLVCVALTYLAEQFGGILQASLTIFGVVACPLFAVFTLGMLTTRGNRTGALGGLVLGITFSAWLGFGAALMGVRHPKLPQETYGCTNSTMFEDASILNGTVLFNATMPTPAALGNQEVFYLYRLSYMWMAPLGFFSTLLAGYIISLISGGNEDVNPDLISPVLWRYYFPQRPTKENMPLVVKPEENGHNLRTNGTSSQQNSGQNGTKL